MFVFRGRRGDILKVLWLDGQGLMLLAKRLEHGRFVWPQADNGGGVVLTPAQLSMLLEGIDWRMAPQGDKRLVRLPQEDMCQAKGLPPTAKYEADGVPGIDAIFQLLEGSMTREQDRRVFFQAQVLFRMLCATDGHATNFSHFIRPGGCYQLTPLYDVLSAYPVLGEGPSKISPHKARLAMAVRTKNAHRKVCRTSYAGTGWSSARDTASSPLMGARHRRWSTTSWRERRRCWPWCARSCRTASRQT